MRTISFGYLLEGYLIYMSDKKAEFLKKLEELGESEVRERLAAGTASVYQRQNKTWAEEWVRRKTEVREQAQKRGEEARAVESLQIQREGNLLNKKNLVIALGLLLVAVAALYFGK